MTERALTPLPLAFHPELPRSQFRDRMILGDKEAFRETLSDVERDLGAVIAEVRREPNAFFYPVGEVDETLSLLDMHRNIPTPALATFVHALEGARDDRAAEKHRAEIAGFTILQEELLTGGVGSTYVWSSPQDPGVEGYATMSKLWVGTFVQEGESSAVRAIDIPLDITLEEHCSIVGELGRKDLLHFLNQPNDFLRHPLVFRADRTFLSVNDILRRISRIIPLPRNPESLVQLLSLHYRETHPLAKKYARDILFHPHPYVVLGLFFQELGMPKLACGGAAISFFDLRPSSPMDRILRTLDGVACYRCGQSQLRLQETCPFCSLKRVC